MRKAKLFPVTGLSQGKDNEWLVLMGEGGQHLYAYAGSLAFGAGAMVSDQLEIGMPDKPVESFRVGDHCRIYAGQIAPRSFLAGDFLTIHEGVWCYGRNDVVIGHNCWFGRRCTLDAEGRFRVGNGFGAGQDSHMWSHVRHGDQLIGNRYLSFGEFWAGDDVWLTGRCTSAPVRHEDRSMALVESNLTKGMGMNTLWGGNPAVDLTAKMGQPVRETTREQRTDMLWTYMKQFSESRSLSAHARRDLQALVADVDVERRTYTKTGSPVEVEFIRWLLPEVKLVPRGQERIG